MESFRFGHVLIPSSFRGALDDSKEMRWSVFKRIGFRYLFCYLILYYEPFGAIPGIALLVRWCSQMWGMLAGLIGIFLFNFDSVQSFPHPTGSGDTAIAYIEQALSLIIAFAATTVWTILDQKSRNYAWLERWLRILARYALAFTLFSYAFAKIVPTQFVHLQVQQLNETYGQSTPMALLWRFMGFSRPYTMFGGFAELLPSALLLWRRTALLGSLLAFAVLLNIVALNFCYDVPVKLYSLNLLLLTIYLVFPDRVRLASFFVTNDSVAPSNISEPVLIQRHRRAAQIVKVVVISLILVQNLSSAVQRYRVLASRKAPPPSTLTTTGFHWVQEYPNNK